MDVRSQFDRYASVIRGATSAFGEKDPLPAGLRMRAQGGREVFYAPFDYVNPGARVVLVGITPGKSQANEALRVARERLRAGATNADAQRAAKVAASFGGTTRRHLVDMLDRVGLPDKLGLATSGSLWDVHSHLVHFTSALRYPVFDKGANYTGAGIDKSPFLREELEAWFAHECRALPRAIFIPLGKAVESACALAVQAGHLKREQLLQGLPHPSPSNIESIVYFLGRKRKEDMSLRRPPAPIDDGRERAIAAVAAWNP